MLLSWTSFLSYTTIYFFVKKFIFSNFYILVNTIFECLNMFLVEKGLRNWQRHFFCNISSKNLKWKQHIRYILELSTFEYGCLVELHIKERKRSLVRSLVLGEFHCWYDLEKLTVSGSSNLNLSFSGTQQKSFVLKRWKKNVLHFVLLNLMQRFL